MIGQIYDRRIKHDKMRLERGQTRQHSTANAGIDHGRSHRSTLIDAENDLPLGSLALSAKPDPGFRNDGLVLDLIVPEIRSNGSRPVHLCKPGTPIAFGAIECANDRGTERLLQTS